MALENTIDWDSARVVSSSSNTRNLRDAGEDFFNRIETTYEETRELNAVERTVAVTAVSEAEQPESSGIYDIASYSYQMSEDDRYTGSCTVTRTFTGKSIEFADPPA